MMRFLEAAARNDEHALQRGLDLVEPFAELELALAKVDQQAEPDSEAS